MGARFRGTFAWSFQNRGQPVPPIAPKVTLIGPSGAVWTWNEDTDGEAVEGLASEFCQVVTQCRNVADTNLKMTGAAATAWMHQAQCFAGPPMDPPAPGARYRTVG